MPPSPPDPRPLVASGVLLGAGMVGMADILDAIAASAVPLSGGARAGLGLAGGLLLGLLTTALCLPLVVAMGRRIATLAGDPPRWAGFWMGLGLGVPTQLLLGLALGAGLDWRHAAAGLLAPIAAGAVALAAPAGRGRIFAVMLGLAPFVVQVELGRRVVRTGGFPAADAPDVLLVTIEGMRGGAWPAPAPRLETVDRLGAEGVRFDRAITPTPAVGPALIALLEGRLPWRPAAGTGLATGLRAAGWQTAAFSGRPAASAPHLAGFEQARAGAPARSAIQGSLLDRVLHSLDLGPRDRRPDREVVDDAWAWMGPARADPNRPVFAWVHLAGPSAPSTPTPPWDTAYASGDPWDPGQPPLAAALDLPADVAAAAGDRTDPAWLLSQQAGAASAADAELGRLLEHLQATAADRPLVVAVVGTHGQALGERGLWLRDEAPPTTDTAQVLMVLWAPGRLPRGTRTNEVVSIADLPATMLELAGAAEPEASTGASLVPTAFGRRGRGWAGTRGVGGRSATLFGRWWQWPTPGDGLSLEAGSGPVDSPPRTLGVAAESLAAGKDPGPADPELRDLAAP
jgi:arylsulfatase A-like enzyme